MARFSSTSKNWGRFMRMDAGTGRVTRCSLFHPATGAPSVDKGIQGITPRGGNQSQEKPAVAKPVEGSMAVVPAGSS